MHKIPLSMGMGLIAFSAAFAQSPSVPRPGENGILRENLASFSAGQTEIRKVDGHWELWAGSTKIKNLGSREADAREVLHLIRTFNLSQRGTVGEPPIMEYWLSNGRAPQKMGRANSVIFDPETLQVANVQGQWCLIDETRPWLTFGAQEADARKSLEIIRKYEFTEILYVNPLNPVMMVFLAGHDRRPKTSPTIMKSAVNSSQQGFPGKPDNKNPGQWFQPPQLHVNPTLAEPVTGRPMWRFDWRQAAVHSKGFDWQLVAGDKVLAQFGSREPEAREALRAVQSLHLTERCQIGESTPVFTFFLMDGQPSRTIVFGAKTVAFDVKNLNLRQVAQRWAICEFDRVLLTLGSSQEEAQQVLKVFQYYKLDHLCQLGSADPSPITVLVRTH
jgi:hypothetical protein